MTTANHGRSPSQRRGLRRSVLVLVVALTVFAWTLAKARHVRPPVAAATPSYVYSIAPHTAATMRSADVAAPQNLQPDHLYIPALRVAARIVPVDATVSATGGQRTVTLTPPQPQDVGLYTGAARTDSAQGTVLIVGHINLDGVRGAFSELSATPLAADVWVTDSADQLTRWRVYANPVVNKHSATWPVDVFDPSGPRRLVLASCTGTLSYVDGFGYSYDDNQFIYATPVAA